MHVVHTSITGLSASTVAHVPKSGPSTLPFGCF